MSSELIKQVFESNLDGDLKLVALALAFHANDEGLSLFASVPCLAWETCRSERTVSAALVRLRDLGVLVPTEPLVENCGRLQPRGGHHRGTDYRFVVDALPKRLSWKLERQVRREKGCRKLHPFQIKKGRSDGPGRVLNAQKTVGASIDPLTVREKEPPAAARPDMAQPLWEHSPTAEWVWKQILQSLAVNNYVRGNLFKPGSAGVVIADGVLEVLLDPIGDLTGSERAAFLDRNYRAEIDRAADRYGVRVRFRWIDRAAVTQAIGASEAEVAVG